MERGDDLKAYARGRLKKRGRAFSYCNLVYQVLASNMPELASKFGALVGRPVTHQDERWVYGRGWKWEHSAGQPLGPHGLHMSKEVGTLLGECEVFGQQIEEKALSQEQQDIEFDRENLLLN